jgi:hypothetical protein
MVRTLSSPAYYHFAGFTGVIKRQRGETGSKRKVYSLLYKWPQIFKLKAVKF